MRIKMILLSVLLLAIGTVNAALPVTNGLVMYLDADAITGVANGAAVATWSDLSGNGNNAVPPTAANQPIYVASSASYNGLACVQFDGVDDWMDLNEMMITVNNFTLFCVGKFDRADGANMYFFDGQQGSGDTRLRIASYNGNIQTRVGSMGDQTLIAGRSTDMHVYTLVSATTGAVQGFVDGVNTVNGTNASGLNPTAFNLGSYNHEKDWLQGSIAQMIVYNRPLTSEEIQSVYAYLTGPKIVGGAAHTPNPENDAVVDLTTLSSLSWQFNTDPNIVSITGDVVFGTEPNMLLNTTYPNVTSPMNLASKGIYLDYDKTYYWRVDSHIVWDSNEITGNWQDTKEGFVWTFTTFPQNKVPVVTANSFLTAMEYLPDVLTATVDDFGEGDVESVNWEVLVPALAKRIINRTAQGDLDNLTAIDPTLVPLLQDWIGSDTFNVGRVSANPLKLTLKGLPSGTYSWTSYHHDAQNQHGTFDATVYDASGTTTTTGIAITNVNSTPVAVFTTSIVSDGVNDVVVAFKLQPHGGNIDLGFIVLNGFELTSGTDSLKIDFGAAAVAGDPGVPASPLMAGYQAYEATTQQAASFTQQSYSAFGTTVSILPTWGGIAVVTKITSDPKLETQQATFTTDRDGTYSVQISATDGPNTGSAVQTVTVAANACAAAQASTSWVGFNTADLNKDCLVNLEDFATLAAQWLDNRNLPAQE
jgi:hypothetical protein